MVIVLSYLITIPSTMAIGGTTYNVVIGKTVMELADDGYMDPVSGPFYRNSQIKKVIIRDGVSIEGGNMQYMFAGSTVEEVYNIPEGVTDMYAAFYACTKLTRVEEIPTTVKTMGYAFAKCRALTGEITVKAANVEDIDRTVFMNVVNTTIYATGKTYQDLLEKGKLTATAKLVEF